MDGLRELGTNAAWDGVLERTVTLEDEEAGIEDETGAMDAVDEEEEGPALAERMLETSDSSEGSLITKLAGYCHDRSKPRRTVSR